MNAEDILKWDPNYVKVTKEEQEILEQAEEEIRQGDYITEEDFWKQLEIEY